MRTLFIFIAALFCGCGTAWGQASPDSVKHRNDCRLAEQIISTGHPQPHAAWASTEILTCGHDVFTRTALTALQQLRASSDTSALGLVWNRVLLRVNSQAVFDAALDIAQDRSASVQARAFAFLGMLRMLRPNAVLSFSTVTNTTDRPSPYRSSYCYDGFGPSTRPWVMGSPVAVDGASRVRAVGSAVWSDAGTAPELRAAAYCAARL
jgi:hypothetical protein